VFLMRRLVIVIIIVPQVLMPTGVQVNYRVPVLSPEQFVEFMRVMRVLPSIRDHLSLFQNGLLV